MQPTQTPVPSLKKPEPPKKDFTVPQRIFSNIISEKPYLISGSVVQKFLASSWEKVKREHSEFVKSSKIEEVADNYLWSPGMPEPELFDPYEHGDEDWVEVQVPFWYVTNCYLLIGKMGHRQALDYNAVYGKDLRDHALAFIHISRVTAYTQNALQLKKLAQTPEQEQEIDESLEKIKLQYDEDGNIVTPYTTLSPDYQSEILEMVKFILEKAPRIIDRKSGKWVTDSMAYGEIDRYLTIDIIQQIDENSSLTLFECLLTDAGVYNFELHVQRNEEALAEAQALVETSKAEDADPK